MPKQKGQRSRIKVGKLQKSITKLNKTEQKKVKGGVFADGSVRVFGDGSVRSIKDGTSNT
jgi:hypothetical protein